MSIKALFTILSKVTFDELEYPSNTAVSISQLLFPLNFNISFEGKVLYFYKNIRNFVIEKCQHIFMFKM